MHSTNAEINVIWRKRAGRVVQSRAESLLGVLLATSVALQLQLAAVATAVWLLVCGICRTIKEVRSEVVLPNLVVIGDFDECDGLVVES